MDKEIISAAENEKINISTNSDDGFDSVQDVTSSTINEKPVSLSSTENVFTVNTACIDMMEKVGEYLNHEMAATCEDYKLLQNLNQLTIANYDEMAFSTKHLVSSMQDINDKYKSLLPYLSQIDLLAESIVKLEQTAYKLDIYSKSLETKFKAMERR